MRRFAGPRLLPAFLAACVGLTALLIFAQEPPAAKAAKVRPSAEGASPTDAQVLEAIQRGVENLLQSKKGDNWETEEAPPKRGHAERANDRASILEENYGGQTAIALYALLHAGKALDDPRLDPKSPELGPVVKWLSELEPQGTYTAGLMANALALLPPNRPEKTVGLTRAWGYLMTAMGAGGGYTYTGNSWGRDDFYTLWAEYFRAKASGNAGALTKAKDALDGSVKNAPTYYGGMEKRCQALVAFLKESAKTDPAIKATLGAQLAELEKYVEAAGNAENVRELTDAKNNLAKALDELNSGKYGQTKDNSGKMVNKTKDQVEREVAQYKQQIAKLQGNPAAVDPMGDLSNGQYGTLGAWALEEGRIEIPNGYWAVSDMFWRKTQLANGTWPYSAGRPDENLRPTMTVAGIASLFITSEYNDTEVRLLPKPDKNIDLGLAWLDKNYQPTNDLYYLYGCERVGLAAGIKFFGKNNWYREGARTLLSGGRGGSWDYHGPTVGTAYALLFLTRGRHPVAFNKLQYAGPWNARPRDVAHLTEWISKEAEKAVNWQVVDLHLAPEEWLDAPVLLITGSQDPKFTPQDLAKLRAFVNAGGVIFSCSDGASEAFTRAVQHYMGEICKDEDGKARFEPRQLPRDHVLFSKDCWQPVTNPPALVGLSNGARELWIHSPQDYGAAWQRRALAARDQFVIPADVCFYAAGGKKEMRTRLQPLTVAAPAASPNTSVSLARVSYPGNWDPEPGAWPRMVKLAAADYRLALKLSTVGIEDLGQLDPRTTPLAHLTGTTRFTVTPAAAAALHDYLDKGGMLFADTVGGTNADFIAAVQDLLKAAYPAAPPVTDRLAPAHALYAGAVAGAEKITEVTYRKAAQLKLRPGFTPRLEGFEQNGRLKVILSPEDVTSGLLGTQTQGIVGYTPDSAESLAANILFYAANAR